MKSCGELAAGRSRLSPRAPSSSRAIPAAPGPAGNLVCAASFPTRIWPLLEDRLADPTR